MKRPSARHGILASQMSGVSLLVLVMGIFTVYAADGNRPFGIGTLWTYQVSQTSGTSFVETQKISGLEMCGLRVCLVFSTETNEGRTIQWVTRDWILMRAMHIDENGNTQLVTYQNGIRIYKLPIRVGDSWTWDTPATRTITIKETERRTPVVRTEDFTVYALRKVVDIEKVRVPAGEYSAYVIEHFDQNGVIRQKLWFSSEAGESVKYVSGFFSIYRTLWELKEHHAVHTSLEEFFQLNLAVLTPLPLLMLGAALVVAPPLAKRIRLR